MKKYYTISEVSKMFNIHAHQLRYIEKIAPNLEVFKLKGRRYYTQENIDFIKSFIPGFTAAPMAKSQNHQDILHQIESLVEKFLKVKDSLKLIISR